jgi:pimeloyl-ACP methyl ester carboxylesterase
MGRVQSFGSSQGLLHKAVDSGVTNDFIDVVKERVIVMKYAFTQLIPGIEWGVLTCCLVAMLLTFAGCSEQKELRPPLEEIPMKQISVEGLNISYIEKGEGNPLVFVHGIPTSSFLWRDMIEKLSAHGRVIALDLPGFGFSDPPPNGDYSISNYAGIFEAFLEALSIERATLVCHDYGGPIALTYALRNPEKYDRLIILDTFLHTNIPPWPLSMKIARIRPFGEIIMRFWGQDIARWGLEGGVMDKSRISDGIVQRYYMPDGNSGKMNKTMLGTLRVDYMEDLKFIEKNLKTIEKPTLILWGENDMFLPLSLGKQIHRDIAGSKMEILPNCGHFIQEDQPDRATEIIVEFLNAGSYDAQIN